MAGLFEDDVKEYRWARRASGGYELSTVGDKRFSALHARLKDGRTIEQAYQLDVKGYRAVSSDWMDGKGKPPLTPMTQDALWEAYKALWRQWARENPKLMHDLMIKAEGKVLTDCFASSPISQARALCELLNESLAEASKFFDKTTVPETGAEQVPARTKYRKIIF